MKKSIYSIVLLVLAMILASCGASQKVVDNRSVKEKIESQRYKFIANYAIPTSAGFQPRYLTSEYDLKVTPDTITAYLPYFGRAYEAPLNSSEGGIKFTSTKFEYVINTGKKPGNWIINIRIKDQLREILLTLDVWNNGKGDLNVWDQNRQPILFQGELE
ncbi:conserved exported hypothetical protein [uncultured Paludibacter sp.]|uniref:DUF4251 domain-containing protein n=1 Tax=uncultured Paludibacter sp. TaxID=497635 RepID=A0A653AG54_9BACT|nr:conserved exported hypothetical protein [uncultured Paludibacter sp.]